MRSQRTATEGLTGRSDTHDRKDLARLQSKAQADQSWFDRFGVDTDQEMGNPKSVTIRGGSQSNSSYVLIPHDGTTVLKRNIQLNKTIRTINGYLHGSSITVRTVLSPRI